MATNISTIGKTYSTNHRVMTVFNLIVLILSSLLIIWISIDTFERVNFIESHSYMTFQLWVCVFFIIDFFVGLYYAHPKRTYFRRRLLFLILAIPYLNIVNALGINIGSDALFFVRFIPLARGALAVAIVISYISHNAVTSMFMSYLNIMLFVVYFCSLIFYQREAGVNPDVTTYWTALWWSAMNMSTVGCAISPVTVSGKIVAVVLPVAGMIIFPMFTVYLTDFVTHMRARDPFTQSQDKDEKKG